MWIGPIWSGLWLKDFQALAAHLRNAAQPAYSPCVKHQGTDMIRRADAELFIYKRPLNILSFYLFPLLCLHDGRGTNTPTRHFHITHVPIRTWYCTLFWQLGVKVRKPLRCGMDHKQKKSPSKGNTDLHSPCLALVNQKWKRGRKKNAYSLQPEMCSLTSVLPCLL